MSLPARRDAAQAPSAPAPHAQAAAEAAPILFDEGWHRLSVNGIQKLQDMIRQHNEAAERGRPSKEEVHFTNQEFSQLYTIVYNMCIQKQPASFAPELYENYGVSIHRYLRTTVIAAIQQKRGEFLLKELVLRWHNHLIMMRWLREMFKYLDRFYVPRHNKVGLLEVGMTAFKTLVFDAVKRQATQAVLQLVEQDRRGVASDRDLIKDAAGIYVRMGMNSLSEYEEELELPLLQATQVFYSAESDRWLESDSCPQYLAKAEQRLAEETRRAREYLHGETTTAKLQQVLYQTLLVQHQQDILGSATGTEAMLAQHATDDLTRMYSLYSHVKPSLDPIALQFRGFVRQVGTALVGTVEAAPDSQSGFVEQLIRLHDKYFELVKRSFQGSAVFHRALTEAFEAVVNLPVGQTTTSELLAQYVDGLLLKGGSRSSDAELDETLDRVVRVFTYLTDKDLFAESYRKLLARRLLSGRSASTDAENSMIVKLKLRCGAQFTSKLEGMITDIRHGADRSREFAQHRMAPGATPLGVEFDVQVLTAVFWPSYPAEELRLGPELDRCAKAFAAYYESVKSSRKLTWVHSLGEVTLAGNFPRKRVDLVGNTVQATVLLLFNEYDELTVEAIGRHTGLLPDETKKCLRSLVAGQSWILVKNPPDGYGQDHVISVNAKFTHQQRRVRLQQVAAKPAAAERDQTQAAVSEDRKHSIEANIVRIMKARKSLHHANLMTEVSQQLMQWFRPDPREIKKRIEDLIAREYLKRDAGDNTLYHYLA